MSTADSGKGRVENWTYPRDAILIDLLMEHYVKTGVKPGTQKSTVFNEILRSFNQSARVCFTKEKLINRWRNLRKDYVLYNDLCNRIGWGWDDSTKLPVPSGVSGWDEVIAINAKYSRIRDKPYLFMQPMRELCGSTTATGSYSFSSRPAVPPWQSVPFTHDDGLSLGLQSAPTPIHHSGGYRYEADDQGSMPSRWSTTRMSDSSPYQDDGEQGDANFIDLLVQGTGTTWQEPTEDERSPHLSGDFGQPPDASSPPPGWSTPPRRVNVFDDDATSPLRPTSSRRLSSGSRQRRSKQPQPLPLPPPQPLPQPFPEDVIKYMNMCRERYEKGNEVGSAPSASSSRAVDEPRTQIRQCLGILRSLSGLSRDEYLTAVDLFYSEANREIFLAFEFEDDRLEWILKKISS